MAFPPLQIDPVVQAACPNLRLGLLTADVEVQPTSDALMEEITAGCKEVAEKFDATAIKDLPTVAATRVAYKALGKDPSRYRPSAEALLRRTVQGKGLYQVNNVVDLLNLVSIKTGFSIGGYDTDKIQGPVMLKRGGSETYEGIGRGPLNIDGLPVLYDTAGPFGSPTSDSERTKITENCRNILMVFFDFDGNGRLEDTAELAGGLLQAYSSSGGYNFKLVP